MTSTTTNYRNLGNKFFKTMLVAFSLYTTNGFCQTNSYLGLNGGFEGAATIVNGTTNSAPVATNWTKSTTSATIANETSTVRSGANSMKVTSSSATLCRVFSPSMTISASTTAWQVQYYRRAASTTNTVQNQTGNYRNGAEQANGTYNTVTAANTWEKVTYSPSSTTSATTAAAHMLVKVIGSGTDMFYDDFVLYESASIDNTAPGAPGSFTFSGQTATSIGVSWAAAGSVDGGGYIVVRGIADPTTAPNVNGIYAVNNTIAAGMTVVFQGTGTSFTDVGLASSTTYFYRVYTYDKAYNYSTAVTGNTSTTSGAPTINGVIGAGEYGTHTNGSNQQSSTTGTWYMTWDATNLYIGIAGTNTAEGAVVYLDKNPIIPVNGGTNSDGNLVGYNNYDGSNFANLQFRADLVVYFKDGYREYRTADGAGGWSAQTSGAGNYASTAGGTGTKEISIPWSAIGGQPSAFNWFGYVAYSGGGAYASVPTENPGSGGGLIIGSSARWDRYYTVSTTSTLPFSRNSYTFTSASDVTSFGPITAYDYTMNSSGRFVSRTGNTAGNWVIGGNITVGAGTIYLGSGGGSYGTTSVAGNLNILGGTFDMDQTNAAVTVTGNVSIASGATLKLSGTTGGDLNVAGNWSNAGTFTPSTRLVQFNGGAAQTLSGSTTFDYIKLNNTNGLTLQTSSPVTVNTNFDLTLGKVTLGANNLTMGSAASFSNQGATSYIVTNSTGALVRNSVGNTATPFPAGLAASYTPLTVTNTGTTNNLSLVVTSPPANTVTDATKIVNLEWNLNSGGAGAVVTTVFNWNTPSNVGASYNATGTGELGNYTAGPNYAITAIGAMSGTSKSVSGISLTSGANKLVLGNTGAVYAVPPANNDCSGATLLTVGNSPVTGDVLNATQSVSAILCNTNTGNSNDDVWYQFTTGVSGNYVITVVGSTNFDAVVDLRSGACTGTTIACADATAANGTETITFGLAATTTYYVRVYDYNAGYPTTTTFTIAVAAPVPSLTATVSSLSFGNQNIQTASSSQTFNINATALSPASGNITVSAPNTDWTVSSDNSTFGSTALVAYTGNTITNAPVYVKFNPQTAGSKTGINVTFSGGSVGTPPTIALTGTGVVPAPTVAAATNIACTSFDANWSAVTGATSYSLDVSTSSTYQNTATPSNEDFEGNSLANWSNTGNFLISNSVPISGTYSLRLNAPAAQTTSYTYTQPAVYDVTTSTTTWRFNIKTNYAPSSNNKAFVFLMSNQTNLTSANGYVVGFNFTGTDDLIKIWKSTSGSSVGVVLASTQAVVSGTVYGVEVTRNSAGLWSLNYKVGGGFTSMTSAGTATDATYTTSTYAGLVSYSSSSNNTNLRFDDFSIATVSPSFVSGYQDLNVGNVTTYSVNTNLTANTLYYYRVRAVNNSIASANSGNTSVTLTSSGIWVGTTSTDWFTAANWCGAIPTATTDVTIPSGTTFSPSIGANGAVCRNITINNGATLTVSGAYTLTVSGDWTLDATATFAYGTGTVDFNKASGTQTATRNSGGFDLPFYNLSHSGAGTLQIESIFLSQATINGDFTNTSGTVDFTNNPYSLFFYGNWSNTGTVIGNKDFEFRKASGTQTFDNGGSTLYAVDHIGAGTLQFINNNLTVSYKFMNNTGSGPMDFNGKTITTPDFTNNGTTSMGLGTLILTGSSFDNIVPTQFNNLTFANGSTPLFQDGGFSVNGNFVNDGTINPNGQTVTFNGTAAQSIGGAVASSFHNLVFTNTSNVVTSNQDFSIAGTLTVNSGATLSMAGNQISGAGSVVVNGTFKTSRAAGFSGGVNAAVKNTISGITLGSTSTVDYIASGGNQTITAGNYANLTNSVSGNRTLANGTIGISGTFTPGSGNYTIGTSTVEFNGSAPQTVPALAPDSKYNNLKINNSAGVSMVADLNLEDALTLTSGAFTTTGYAFTLLSTATQTARVAPITSGSIIGNVTMQRFVPGGTSGWATLGMPLTGRTIADWTDDIVTSGFIGSTTGTGTFVSIYGYDETVNGTASNSAAYVAIDSAGQAVDPKKGYFVFVADNALTVANKTIDVTGPILTGSQNMNVTFTSYGDSIEDGWNLVSNPYCSAIDWTSGSWTKAHMDNAVYIYNADSAQYTGFVDGMSYLGGNEIIGSSQAFLVHANAASPSLIANEGVKDAGSPTFYKPVSSTSVSGVLRLQLDGLSGKYFDETIFRTRSGATSNFDAAYDAYKLYSFDYTAPNICTKVNGVEYVVNSVEDLSSNMDVPVRVNVNTPGTYTINFKGLQNFGHVDCFTFQDLLTNTTIDLNTDSSYTFTSAIDTVLSYNRFVLHFGVESIVASVTPSATTVSIPGNATVNFVNNTSGASTYSWNFGDGSPLDNGVNASHTYTTAGTYTVTLTALNNAGCNQTTTVTITVDDVTAVKNTSLAESLEITKDAQGFHANYNFKNSTKVKISIYNALGEQIGTSQNATVQNKGNFAVNTPEMAKGIYTIEVLFDNRKITQKIDF